MLQTDDFIIMVDQNGVFNFTFSSQNFNFHAVSDGNSFGLRNLTNSIIKQEFLFENFTQNTTNEFDFYFNKSLDNSKIGMFVSSLMKYSANLKKREDSCPQTGSSAGTTDETNLSEAT